MFAVLNCSITLEDCGLSLFCMTRNPRKIKLHWTLKNILKCIIITQIVYEINIDIQWFTSSNLRWYKDFQLTFFGKFLYANANTRYPDEPNSSKTEKIFVGTEKRK